MHSASHNMLLRFTSFDILNTSLIDVATGERAYEIRTVQIEEPVSKTSSPHNISFSSSVTSASSSIAGPSSQPPSPTLASSSPAFVKRSCHSEDEEEEPEVVYRRTTVTDLSGALAAEINWKGRHPTIHLHDEKVGALTDLFGSTTVRFMPKILAIPTRFDTELVWTATSDSLTLFDYDSEATKGTFHQSVIRLPAGAKTSKSKLSSPSKFKLSSSSLSSDPDAKSLRSTFIPTHIAGLGSNYLEFDPHPLANDVEIILSFLMMEILRRGRFNLTPYTFDGQKHSPLKEVKDSFFRRFRRYTV